MADKKTCVRCGRGIDAIALICPYCNWDQAQPVTAEAVEPQAPVYVPPQERSWKRTILIGIGIIAVLIASFAVGMVINRDGTPDAEPEPVTTQKQPATTSAMPENAAPLVEMGTTIETPITSAPVPLTDAGAIPNEYQRHDATAVSSVEYAQLAQRAEAERKRREQMAVMTDPRTLTGPAYAQTARPVVPRPKTTAPQRPAQTPAEQQVAQQQTAEQQATPPRRESRVAMRTRPVPRYTPVPRLPVPSETVAKVDLVVGADGHVRDVSIRDGIPGHTAKLIAAIQTWRFQPATENGEPVSAQFSVDISFRGNE